MTEPGHARPRGGKLQGVEAARGVAALLVVLVHTDGILELPQYFGRHVFDGLFIFARAGVDFFFVLSGFIIAYVHANDVGRPDRLGDFAWKRFARIFPTYWIVSLILLAILQVSPTQSRQEADPFFLLSSALLLPSLDGPLLNPGWSLRHELLFYGLFGLCLLDRRLGRAALLVWAGGILLNLGWATASGRPLFGGIWNDLVFRIFNIQFFFGLAVAGLLLRRTPVWRPRLLLAAGVLLFFGTGLLDSWGPRVPHEWPPKHLSYALGAALVLLGLVGAERQDGLRVPRWLVALGAASYALYLTHVIVVMVGAFLIRQVRPTIVLPLEPAFAGLVIAAVLAALLFHRWIEAPMLRRLRQPPWRRRGSPTGPRDIALRIGP